MWNDIVFAVVAGAYILIGFAVLCFVTWLCEAVFDAAQRRRRKKYRNNYVRYRFK